MLVLPAILTREDFDHCNWQQVVNDCEQKDCLYYESRLFKKAEETHKTGDLKAEAVFASLGAVSSFILNLDSKETPFGPLMALEGSRYPIPDDLTDGQLAVLKELVPAYRMLSCAHVLLTYCGSENTDVRWQNVRLRAT